MRNKVCNVDPTEKQLQNVIEKKLTIRKEKRFRQEG